ncbi:MAG: hypothetical protein ACRD4O_12135, partial [Bryobacteraceae bacterium]
MEQTIAFCRLLAPNSHTDAALAFPWGSQSWLQAAFQAAAAPIHRSAEISISLSSNGSRRAAKISAFSNRRMSLKGGAELRASG